MIIRPETFLLQHLVECVSNVMAHAQKPDFFRRKGRVHLNRRGRQFSRLLAVRISGSNAGYTMFRGSVKSTGYPIHSTVSSSHPIPCVTVCHHISTGLLTRSFQPWIHCELRLTTVQSSDLSAFTSTCLSRQKKNGHNFKNNSCKLK